MARIRPLACACIALFACARAELGATPAGGPCARNADCLEGLVCFQGKCAAPSAACVAGEVRCAGMDVQTCAEGGWTVTATCTAGCSNGACVAPACATGERKCDPDGYTLLACDGAGLGWSAVAFCNARCDAAKKTCAQPVCAPFGTRCNDSTVETCRADASGYDADPAGPCPLGCTGGACVKPGPCVNGTKRCNGSVVESCDAGAWRFQELCAAACLGSGSCSVCIPGLTRCSGTAVERCKADGSAFDTVTTCTTACVSGACSACKPGSRQCSGSGDGIDVCLADGSAYVFFVYCSFGCDVASAACKTPTCAPLSTRCKDAATLETCQGNGQGYVATACGAGSACDASACRPVICTAGDKRCLDLATLGTCNAAGTGFTAAACGANEACVAGACKPITCAPGSTTCATSTSVDLCNATGTGTVAIACPSGQTCSNGVCVGAAGVCVHGQRRCVGVDVEECNPSGTVWVYVQTCTSSCFAGKCAGAACTPFTLTATPSTLPADGNSRTLATSGLIADELAVPVPDGTMFTVAATAGTVAAQDADSGRPGIQVRSSAGRIDFAVTAATTAGATADLTAELAGGSKCSARTTVSFAPAGTTVSVADDLTGATLIDGAKTSAFHNLRQARAEYATGVELGTGEDGDLYVPTSTQYNLSSNAHPGRVFPDAVAFPVTAIGADYVVVPMVPMGLAPGDEAVLINMQGRPSVNANVGNREILTVKSVDFLNNRVNFTTPVQGVYGAGAGNSDLSGQKIMVQRVPRYGNVNISGLLYASNWNRTRGTGGLLFFKARGTVFVTTSGQIEMNYRGYLGCRASLSTPTQGESYTDWGGDSPSANSGGGGGGYACDSSSWRIGGPASYGTAGVNPGCGSYPPSGATGVVYGTPDLAKWFMGSGGGCVTIHNAGCTLTNSWTDQGEVGGGGIVVVWAQAMALQGPISSSGFKYPYPCSGGSILLSASNANVGTNLVTAVSTTDGWCGTATGGKGRVRIDALKLVGTTDPPAYLSLPAGVIAIQSKAVDNTAANITRVTIVASPALTTGGQVKFFLANDGATFVAATAGSEVTFSTVGSDLRWRAELDGQTIDPLWLHGIAISYSTN